MMSTWDAIADNFSDVLTCDFQSQRVRNTGRGLHWHDRFFVIVFLEEHLFYYFILLYELEKTYGKKMQRKYHLRMFSTHQFSP